MQEPELRHGQADEERGAGLEEEEEGEKESGNREAARKQNDRRAC